MSLAQQRQIDLLKRQVRQQGEDIAELNRKMDLLLNQFETRIAKAIDKVIGDGIQVEQDIDSQIGALINVPVNDHAEQSS